ncbi:MAG: hypothetical protein ACOZE7_09685 [Pseudomonadota bacterium]
MCLIIKKPAGRRITTDFLENAWRHNHHGWGFFHLEHLDQRGATPQRLVWARGLDFEALISHNTGLPLDAEVYVHLRRATHGDVNHEMAHPFEVHPGLLLMHNGSIDCLAPQDTEVSDTAELARLLRDMLAGLSEAQVGVLIRSQGFQALTAPLIQGSMVLLLDAQGAVRLGRTWHAVRREEWDEAMAGIEVSNTHTWGERSATQAQSPEAAIRQGQAALA